MIKCLKGKMLYLDIYDGPHVVRKSNFKYEKNYITSISIHETIYSKLRSSRNT